MLDILLRNKFYRKCNTAIKLTKARIEIVKRKRNAMQKYLKNDVADLLKAGLDINAFGRAEGLFVELNLTSCYDLANKFCGYVKENLLVLSKQRECPEECQEAVSSIIFAAARFADLPDLRHLRSIFTERYGNALDCYVSKEFVEKLKLTHPTKDATLELMQDIATEAGVVWNSKATEQKLYNPPPAFEKAGSNLADEFHGKAPIGGKLSNISIFAKKKNYLKSIQENSIGTKERETKPETPSHLPEEEVYYKKSFRTNPVPHYTKSRLYDNRNNDKGILRVDIDDFDDISTEKGNSEHRKKVKELPRLHEDQPDEEERWLDKLLIVYGRKSYFRKGNAESTKPSPEQGFYSSKTRKGASWDNRATKSTLSGNAEQKIEAEGTNKQGHIRSTSLQPELLKGGHVHPKLPDDYDDFLAHLAALRNGGK